MGAALARRNIGAASTPSPESDMRADSFEVTTGACAGVWSAGRDGMSAASAQDR